MKDFNKRKGWLFNLVDGPYAGDEIRLGWRLPNGSRIPVDEEIRYPTGVVYRRRQASWESKGKDHEAGDLKFNKDGTPYWEFHWITGTGE